MAKTEIAQADRSPHAINSTANARRTLLMKRPALFQWLRQGVAPKK
jgi:hypothetical protein